jgi:hypothetical protein
LTREKKCITVLLELMASGIISIDKLDLADLISLPEILFIPFVPPSLEPAVKRLRFSDVGLGRPALDSPQIVPAPTELNIPRPAWSGPFPHLDESNMGIAAMMELFIVEYHRLAALPCRADIDEFKIALWNVVSRALAACTFDSPLASIRRKDGLRASDLTALFDHFDRCPHFSAPNVRASLHRQNALGELSVLKQTYIERLSALGVPPSVLRIFDVRLTIVRCLIEELAIVAMLCHSRLGARLRTILSIMKIS